MEKEAAKKAARKDDGDTTGSNGMDYSQLDLS